MIPRDAPENFITTGGCLCRPFRAGDEIGINDCFNRVFKRTRSVDVWRWRFANSWCSRFGEPIIVVAETESDHRIVAQHAAVYVDLHVNGESRPSVQLLDNFSDEDYRGGRRLQMEMYRILRQLGDDNFNGFVGFGYPNPTSYKVGKRLLDYQDVGAMRPFRARLNIYLGLATRVHSRLLALAAPLLRTAGAALTSLRLARIPTGAFRTRRVDAFDERVEAVWESMRRRFPIVAARSQELLRWRHEQRPGVSYGIILAEDAQGALAGYVTTRVEITAEGHRVGYLVDLGFRDEAALPALVRAGTQDLVRQKADYAYCFCTQPELVAPALALAGFTQDPRTAEIQIVYQVNRNRPADNEALKPLVSNIRNWYLTYGDTEII